jgi:hypothetical protein
MTSLSKNARIAGILYILASAIGIVRLLYIPSILFVSGNATATASNITAHESLFRWGILCYLVGGTIWLFVPIVLYRLLSPVNKTLAILMVILGSLMQTPIFIINTVTDSAALQLVQGADYLSVFDKSQRAALALFFLRLHDRMDLAGFVFAGLWLLPFGLLVYRSRFLPRLLGIWLMLECFAWLALVFVGVMRPELQSKCFTMIQPLTFAEVATMLWLVIIGARQKPPVNSS